MRRGHAVPLTIAWGGDGRDGGTIWRLRRVGRGHCLLRIAVLPSVRGLPGGLRHDSWRWRRLHWLTIWWLRLAVGIGLRHGVHCNTPGRVQRNADTVRARRTLLVRGLLRDAHGILPHRGLRRRLPVSLAVDRRSGDPDIAVPMRRRRGSLWYSRTCAARYRCKWLGAGATALCTDTRMPADTQRPLTLNVALAQAGGVPGDARDAAGLARRSADRLALAWERLLVVREYVLYRKVRGGSRRTLRRRHHVLRIWCAGGRRTRRRHGGRRAYNHVRRRAIVTG